MENAEKKSGLKKIVSMIGGNNLVLIGAIVVVFVLFTSLNQNFLTRQNMTNILVAASLVGVVAIGHTYLIIAGQNDLSPGSVAAFSGVMAALLLYRIAEFPVPRYSGSRMDYDHCLYRVWIYSFPNQIRTQHLCHRWKLRGSQTGWSES